MALAGKGMAPDDHEPDDHETDDHETGDHEPGDHEPDDHEPGDHETGDHETGHKAPGHKAPDDGGMAGPATRPDRFGRTRSPGRTRGEAVVRVRHLLVALVALGAWVALIGIVVGAGAGQAQTPTPTPTDIRTPGAGHPLPGLIQAPTLARVLDRGLLVCGTNTGMAGLSAVTTDGRWEGFDVEFCRALAAAVLGDADRVRFVPVNTAVRFRALVQGDIDVLARNTTWALNRDAGQGLSFVGVSLYDGAGLLTWKDIPGDSLERLPDNTRFCVLGQTTTEQVLRDALDRRGLARTITTHGAMEQSRQAFFDRVCDVYAGDRTAIMAMVRTEAPRPEALRLLPEVLSKEPLGPAVREDDPRWFDIVRWTVFALIQAEEYGIGRATLDDWLVTATDPSVRRFLGLDPGVGEPLGLDDQWVRRIIAQVGNYGEVYDRTVGRGGVLNLDRGQNALWQNGGLLYSPPFP